MNNETLAAVQIIAEGVQPKIDKARALIKDIMPIPSRTVLDLRIADIQMCALSEICALLHVSVESTTVGQHLPLIEKGAEQSRRRL